VVDDSAFSTTFTCRCQDRAQLLFRSSYMRRSQPQDLNRLLSRPLSNAGVDWRRLKNKRWGKKDFSNPRWSITKGLSYKGGGPACRPV